MSGKRWGSMARRAAGLVLVGVLAAACSSGGDGGSGGDEKIKLTVGVFGNFGFEDLYKQYMADHPNIEIVQNVTEYNAHHQNLTARLAAGSGAPDVVAIDEGFIVQFKSQPENFLNLLDMGAADIKDRWLPWKWAASMPDADTQIGLGTDVGGLAMCYRIDLFEKAGLPTARDQVSALWPDWESYFDAGRQFKASGVEASWFDSATNIFNAIVNQSPRGYYSPDNQLIFESNPAIREAFDLTAGAVQAGLSAQLAAFSQEWNTGFQKGSFATLTCPAWMMGYIQQQAPKTSGLWDIADVPGSGGNWGGSWLAVPAQTEHPEEAYELAAWLTAPEQELAVFKKLGNLPSQPDLLDSPEVTEFRNEFFNNAPVGEIFASSAKTLRPQYQGPKTGPIRQAFEQALQRIEQGQQSPDDAWAQAVRDANRAAT